MWVIDQMTSGNPAYNLPVAYRIGGALDVGVLEDSFNQLIERHESWRTTFREFEGDAIQEIHPEYKIHITITDIEHLPCGEREFKVSALASEEAVRPFDLRGLPLIRVSLFRLSQNDHVLLVNVHHIIGDGLSLNLMFDELDAIYRAAKSGTTPRLPELPVQYADFAIWQREDFSKERHSGQLDYWQRQLKGDLPVLEMPADKPRPLRQSFNGSTVSFSIPKDLAQALTDLGTQEKSTFFVTVLAALQVILLRYSKAEEIVIGTPVANRPLPEIDRLIGNFINVVALRCDLSGNPAFRELLQRSRETTLNALSNKDLPFEMVVKNLQAHRDASRNPVFQVLMQILPPVHARIGELSVSRFDFELRFAQVDLTLHLFEESDGGFLGQFQYCTDLFATKTIENLSLNFVQLLHEIVRDPHLQILEIPIVAELERDELLRASNPTETTLPAKRAAAPGSGGLATRSFEPQCCIHDLFEAHAKAAPGAVALTFEKSRVTYGELNMKANQLAHHHRSLGVGPEVLVAVCLERSPELLIAILAVLKAGGAYVPLDPDSPGERLGLILTDAQTPVVLTQETLLAKTRGTSATAFCFDRDQSTLTTLSTANPAPLAGPDSAAYVIYTSGSTGMPKGVVVTHHNVVRLFQATDAWFQFGANDVWTLFHSPAFDFSVWEIWGALACGGRLVIVPYLVSRSPAQFYALLADEKVTVLNQTPLAFQQLIRIEDDPAARRDLALRLVIFGGEALDFPALRPWFGRHGDTRPQLVNMYGITETTVHVTYRPVTLADLDAPTGSRIGKAIPDLDLFVLDPALAPCPIGIAGELYVGGAGVARGYLRRPELTAGSFIPHPWKAGARLYKSGDLARRTADDDLEYLGRADKQVKVRGYRIEPGEIEAALLRHPGIAQCAVLVRRLPSGEDGLAAYFVHATSAAPAGRELRAFLQERIPSYMIPAAFIALDALPLNHNGKLDPGALPSPAAQDDRAPADGAVAPRNPLETDIALFWAELLGRNSLSIHDDFFAVGGHSLLAIQLLGRLREKFRVDVPVRRLFDTPTIEGVAQFIAAHLPTPPEPRLLQSLFVLQRGNPGERPFFLVPGGWGAEIEFLVYAQLKLHLGPDLPIFGLKARGSAGLEKPHRSVREMVVDYVEEIRTVQPRGPYLLGGECIGGVLAYEMARRLDELGEKVDLLVLLDTERPNQAALRQFRAEERVSEWKKFWQIQILQPFRDHRENLSHLSLAGKVRYIWHRANRKRGLSAEPTALDRRKLLGHYPRLLMAHPIGAYRGKVTLLIDETSHHALGNLGWDGVQTGGLETHVLPGDHLSYIREHAAAAAAKLREIIDRSNHSTP